MLGQKRKNWISFFETIYYVVFDVLSCKNIKKLLIQILGQ
jgi:hypothetical protein